MTKTKDVRVGSHREYGERTIKISFWYDLTARKEVPVLKPHKGPLMN